MAAHIAAPGTVELPVRIGFHVQAAGDGFFQVISFLAVGAQPANQPLGDNSYQGGGQQVVLHPHIDHTGHGAGSTVGMQGGKEQVSGKGGPHPQFGGFGVTHLSHHDDVRVLAQDGPQSGGESKAGFGVNLHLVDAHQAVFHRIFQGDNIAFGHIYLGKYAVQGGGFTGTGRAGDHNHAVGTADKAGYLGHIGFAESQRLQGHEGMSPVQDTQDYLLPVDGWQGGNTKIYFPAVNNQAGASILGHAFFGDVQVAHDFNTGYDSRKGLFRQV